MTRPDGTTDTMNVIGPLVLAIALSATLLSCSQTASSGTSTQATRANFSQAGNFLSHLMAIARKGDMDAWSLQLTPGRRAKGAEYIARHFKAWRPDLMALDRVIAHAEAILLADGDRHILALRHADGRVDRLMRVSFWGRSLRIDEN